MVRTLYWTSIDGPPDGFRIFKISGIIIDSADRDRFEVWTYLQKGETEEQLRERVAKDFEDTGLQHVEEET